MVGFIVSSVILLLVLLLALFLGEPREVVCEIMGGVVSFICIDLFFLSRLRPRSNQQALAGLLKALLILFVLWEPALRGPVSVVLNIAAVVVVGRFVAVRGAWLWRSYRR